MTVEVVLNEVEESLLEIIGENEGGEFAGDYRGE